MPDDSLTALYRQHEHAIETVIRTVRREFRFQPDDGEDFGQDVRLRLIDPTHRILVKYKGDSNIHTYLYVVVRNLARDRRVQAWGRWRASAPARQHGPAGVRLEMLVIRDGRPLESALPMVLAEFPDEDRARLSALAARFRPQSRRHYVGEEVLEFVIGDHADAESMLMRGEEQARFERVSSAVAGALSHLDDTDQLLLKLCFEQNMSIADAARLLAADQKKLYRQRDAILKRVRDILRDEGFDL
jgi:RNA polymerase sigma factor (sigma-70 family)